MFWQQHIEQSKTKEAELVSKDAENVSYLKFDKLCSLDKQQLRTVLLLLRAT